MPAKITAIAVLILVVVYSAVTAGRAFHYTKTSAGSDLRIREVGSRLLSGKQSPYFYKWQETDGPFYLDPLDAGHRFVNGNVVTPATLLITYPLYQLDHRYVYLIWTILQLLAAAAIILLLFRKGSLREKIIPASLVVAAFFCSTHFLFNLERGQIYIFYTLAFAGMYALYGSGWKRGVFLSGLLCGWMVFFRPFFLLAGVGFLVHWKKQFLLGILFGLVSGFAVLVLPVTKSWQDYSRAMTEYINENMGHATGSPWSAPAGKPMIVEGVDFTQLEGFSVGRLETVYGLARSAGIRLTAFQCSLLLGIAILIAGFILYRRRRAVTGAHQLFLFGFGCYFLSELFTPAPRGAYNMIQWVFPVSLLLIHYWRKRWLVISVVLAMILFHLPPLFFWQHAVAELAFTCILVYSVGFAKEDQTHPGNGDEINRPPEARV